MTTHLVWFRNDLRINDNLALHAACSKSDARVIALFIATPGQWQQHDMAPGESRLFTRISAACRHHWPKKASRCMFISMMISLPAWIFSSRFVNSKTLINCFITTSTNLTNVSAMRRRKSG